MLLDRHRRLAMQLIQAVATLKRPGVELDTGGIDFPPVDNDDDDDDDEEWSAENLDVRFKTQIEKWVKISPVVNKIANIIYENTFSRKPKINIMRHGGGRKHGRLQMSVEWKYSRNIFDDFSDQFEVILRKSDLYKVFGARPEQLWDILGKGDVLSWVITYIYIGFTHRDGRYQSPADKQAAFQVYDFVIKNKKKYDEWIQNRLNPGVTLHITVSSPIASYGQIYGGGFIAGGKVYWEYESDQ